MTSPSPAVGLVPYMQPDEPQEQVLTVAQAAERLQVSTQTIYRIFREGGFPRALKVRRLVRIPEGDLDELRADLARQAADVAAGVEVARLGPPRPREPRGRLTRLARGLDPDAPPLFPKETDDECPAA